MRDLAPMVHGAGSWIWPPSGHRRRLERMASITASATIPLPHKFKSAWSWARAGQGKTQQPAASIQHAHLPEDPIRLLIPDS